MKKLRIHLFHSVYNQETIAVVSDNIDNAIVVLNADIKLAGKIITDDYRYLSSCDCIEGKVAVASTIDVS